MSLYYKVRQYFVVCDVLHLEAALQHALEQKVEIGGIAGLDT